VLLSLLRQSLPAAPPPLPLLCFVLSCFSYNPPFFGKSFITYNSLDNFAFCLCQGRETASRVAQSVASVPHNGPTPLPCFVCSHCFFKQSPPVVFLFSGNPLSGSGDRIARGSVGGVGPPQRPYPPPVYSMFSFSFHLMSYNSHHNSFLTISPFFVLLSGSRDRVACCSVGRVSPPQRRSSGGGGGCDR